MGLVLSEIEERAEDKLEFNVLVHSHQCFSCSRETLERDCVSNGTEKQYCPYEAVMDTHTARADGSDELLLSLKMQCIAENSATPAKTFFRFVTLFYERSCMGVFDNADPDSGEVTIRQSCVEKLIKVFTDDPNSIEKCMWETFADAGDINSMNNRLESDSQQIK